MLKKLNIRQIKEDIFGIVTFSMITLFLYQICIILMMTKYFNLKYTNIFVRFNLKVNTQNIGIFSFPWGEFNEDQQNKSSQIKPSIQVDRIYKATQNPNGPKQLPYANHRFWRETWPGDLPTNKNENKTSIHLCFCKGTIWPNVFSK